ncbi:unnamed protein product [Cyprideis torosa]|uniref:DNA polymerase eta n=1 Tax=Cyprideis torosa TaxID=163714 RepID=A0A7R8W6B9_9CRUS|nr:unnamed protein product [Cyprideis torosa]CAG0886341.1 unnamed protein product [Cyprideis torosa]
MFPAASRIVVLVDMDCFYVQVEERLQPEFKGKPAVVVQYRTFKGGGIIAANYEARALGINRNGMMGDDAVQKCPEVKLFRVPEVRGKADLSRYREAGKEVIQVLAKFCGCVERASVDEAYLDLTAEVERQMEQMNGGVAGERLTSTHVCGWEDDSEEGRGVERWTRAVWDEGSMMEDDRRLSVAAVLVEEMRRAVFETTTFRCSAGIAHNKPLAKLACGLNKPNKQTVLPLTSVSELFKTVKISKVRNLGGKLGQTLIDKLQVETMHQLSEVGLPKLRDVLDPKTAIWVYELSLGRDHEPVKDRQLSQSVGCGKFFRGLEALDTEKKVEHWSRQLADEIGERLEEDKRDNNRQAKSLTLSVHFGGAKGWGDAGVYSRAVPLMSNKSGRIAEEIVKTLRKLTAQIRSSASSVGPGKVDGSVVRPEDGSVWSPPITGLFISAGKFLQLDSKTRSLTSFFKPVENGLGVTLRTPKSPLSVKSEKKKSGIERFLASSSSPSKTIGGASAVVEDTFDVVPDSDEEDMRWDLLEPSVEISTDDGPDGMEGTSSEVFCTECGRMIPGQSYEEHQDYHLASRLQKEWNQTPPVVAAAALTSSSSNKRKRGESRTEEGNKALKLTKATSFDLSTRGFLMTSAQRKTVVMETMVRGDDERVLVPNGTELEVVPSFVYLGSSVPKTGSSAQKIRRRIALAVASFNALNNVWRAQAFSLHTKLRLLNSNVIPVLLYGCESWSPTKSDLQRCLAFENMCLRRILGVPWRDHVTNEAIRDVTRQPPVTARIEERWWMWLGHVLRMRTDKTPHAVLSHFFLLSRWEEEETVDAQCSTF